MNRSTVMQITTINPLLQCHLCTGYLVDATTITECLHSFCRSCIVQYLSTSSVCPMCDQLVHKTRPLSYIRSDKTLQDMVYKLVPRLYQDEMKRRRSFYAENPDAVPSSAQLDVNEQKGIIDKDKDKLRLQSEVEDISLVLYECPYGIYKGFNMQAYESPESCKRYLRCPSNVTIAVLKSFIEKKEMFPSCYKVKIYYIDDILRSTDTLTDIAFFYQWKRVAPLKLLYTIVKSPSSVDPSTATPCANAVNFDPGFASLLRSPSKSTAASHSSNSSSSSSARVGRPSGKSHHNNNNNKSTGNNKLTRRNIARHLSACSSSAAAGSSSSAATSNHSSLASRSCSQLLRQQRQRQMRKRKVYPRHDEKSTRQVRKEQQDDHDDDDDWNSNATRSRKRQRSSKRVSSHDEDSLNESSDDTLVGDVLISPTSAYTSVPDADQTPREEVDKPREVDDGDLKDNLGAAHHTSSDSDTPLSALRSCKPISLSSDATTTSSTTTTANSTSIKAQTKPCWPRLSPSPSIHVKANDTSTPLQQPPQTSNVLPSTMLNSPHKSQVSPVKTCNGVNGFPSADSSKNQTADVCKTLIKTERMEVEEVPPPSNLLDSKEHLKSKLNKLGIATSENTTTNLQQVPTSVCSSSDSTPTPANIKNPTSSVGGGCTTTTTSLTCAIKQSRHGLHVIRPITPSSKSITAVTKTTPPTNAPQQPSTTATTTTTTTTTTSVTHVTRPFQLINKVIAAPTGHQIKNSGQPSSSLPNNASSPTLPILSNRPPTLGSSNANLSSNHVTNPSKPYMRTSIRPPTLPTTSRSATTTASITTSCSNSTVGASINPHVQAPIIISKRTNGYVRILPKPMAPLNNSALNSGHSSNSGSSRGSPSPLTLPPPDIGKLMKKVLAKKSGKNSGTSSLSVKIPDSNAPQTVSSISEQLLRQISSPINTLVTSNNTTTSTSVLHTPSSTAAKATSKTTLTTSLKRKHSSPPNGVHQTPAAVKKRRVTSSDGSNHAPSTPCNNVSPSASLKSAISPDGLKLTIRNDASPILNGKPSPSLQEIVLGSVNASSKHSSHHHHHHSSRQHQSSQSKSDKQNSKEKLNTITIKSEKTTTDDNVTASIANVEVSNKPSCQDKTIGKQCKTNGICNNVSSDKFTSSTSTFTSSKPISTSTTTSSLVNTPSTTTTTSTDTTTNSTTTTSITTSTASDNKNTSTQAKPPLQTAIQMSPPVPKMKKSPLSEGLKRLTNAKTFESLEQAVKMFPKASLVKSTTNGVLPCSPKPNPVSQSSTTGAPSSQSTPVTNGIQVPPMPSPVPPTPAPKPASQVSPLSRPPVVTSLAGLLPRNSTRPHPNETQCNAMVLPDGSIQVTLSNNPSISFAIPQHRPNTPQTSQTSAATPAISTGSQSIATPTPRCYTSLQPGGRERVTRFQGHNGNNNVVCIDTATPSRRTLTDIDKSPAYKKPRLSESACIPHVAPACKESPPIFNGKPSVKTTSTSKKKTANNQQKQKQEVKLVFTSGGMITAQNIRNRQLKPATRALLNRHALPLNVPNFKVAPAVKPRQTLNKTNNGALQNNNRCFNKNPFARGANQLSATRFKAPSHQPTMATSLSTTPANAMSMGQRSTLRIPTRNRTDWNGLSNGLLGVGNSALPMVSSQPMTSSAQAASTSPLAGATAQPTHLSPKPRSVGMSPSLPGDEQPLELTTEVSRERELQRERERGRSVTLSDTPPPIARQATPTIPPPAHNGVLHPILQNGPSISPETVSATTSTFKPLYKAACNAPTNPRVSKPPVTAGREAKKQLKKMLPILNPALYSFKN